MLTLKFEPSPNSKNDPMYASVGKFTVSPDTLDPRVVKFNDEAISVGYHPHSDFRVCYVMNDSGKTIDTIRAGRKP